MIEDIDKRIIDKGFHTGYEVDFVTIQQSDYEYLKEQVERVQELEEENVILKATRAGNEAHIDVLHKQNKRYRSLLERVFQAGDLGDMWDVEDDYRDLEGEE